MKREGRKSLSLLLMREEIFAERDNFTFLAKHSWEFVRKQYGNAFVIYKLSEAREILEFLEDLLRNPRKYPSLVRMWRKMAKEIPPVPDSLVYMVLKKVKPLGRL